MIAKIAEHEKPVREGSSNKRLVVPISNRIEPIRRVACISCREIKDIRHMKEVYFEGKVYVCDVCRKQYLTPTGSRPVPPNPTDFLPGSEGKIQVMIERFEQGYALWHPKDANYGSKHNPEVENNIIALIETLEKE